MNPISQVYDALRNFGAMFDWNNQMATRMMFDQMLANFATTSPAREKKFSIGDIPAVLWDATNEEKNRIILYFHGGGYTLGSCRSHRELMLRISKVAQAEVLGIDYRLAPENPFPKGLEDCTQAYRWLIEQQYPAKSIAIVGDSAGGGLTMATLLSIKEQGLEFPGCGVCISPWVDMTITADSLERNASTDPMVRKEMMPQAVTAYAGDNDCRNPLISPIFGDLKGLPPLLVQTSTSEALYDDSRHLVEKAQQDGVDVEWQQWDSMLHVWHFFASLLPASQEAIDKVGIFIQKNT
jgi:acetyl esterase/lipase